jgi:peptidyl-prolyl cis-trans isomerase C
MVKFGVSALALALVVGAGVGLAQTPKALDDPGDPVIATVNGDAIRRSDAMIVQRQLPPQFQQMPLEMLLPAIVERLIDAKLIAAAGRAENLHVDADVKRRVAQFEERVIQETFLNRRVDAEVTESKVRERYDNYVKNNPAKEEVSARHILVQTEMQAKEVIVELKKGADFAELARARSIDPAGKQAGGDLGFFGPQDMVPEFAEVAFKLKEGETTETPVKTQFGWHVIRVEAHRANAPNFDEMREQIANDLSKEIVEGIVAKLRMAATIERPAR